ncbi:MAG: saccharopine dehydrogenase NADP-binding domain-containing protein [Flavobacteriales bacterium]|nr:saccharopine dehydrogenase NADP-binding domain-containing protein [Flavobacteriales bacterium]MCZ2442503.1 saccharopine dehydrogenase NADP-binding domain-containing protein [Flavobacteriales bacterium]
MKQILVIGAGKSATVLIDYLCHEAVTMQWHVTVADIRKSDAEKKIEGKPNTTAVAINITDENSRKTLIARHDIVISMLPANMHMPVAYDCLALGKHMVTASYVSDEMQALDEEAKAKGLIFLNEIGLDPGIDHMTAMKILDKLKSEGAVITGFETFTGGLLAPESENNPWKYKFTWNPRNVVMAASGGAVKFLHGGKLKYIPYHKVFRRTERIVLDKIGVFEGYANRDSLKYLKKYQLEGIKTLYRGTLRRPGFCKAWDIFVQLGATDDSYIMEGSKKMTHRDFINSFLLYHPSDSVEIKLAHAMRIDLDTDEMLMLEWLGVFENEPIGLEGDATPAQILQHILEKKWTLSPDDKDMIVMYHKFNYQLGSEDKEIKSTLVVYGKDSQSTAMAQTVGLPVGIATKLILLGEIKTCGVQIPLTADIYNPVLDELVKHQIVCSEYQVK